MLYVKCEIVVPSHPFHYLFADLGRNIAKVDLRFGSPNPLLKFSLQSSLFTINIMFAFN